MEIPHNLIVSEGGEAIYIIPRKFEKKNSEINSCWSDISGLLSLRQEKYFKEFESKDVDKFYQDEVTFDGGAFDEIIDKIVNKFNSIYIIKSFI